MNCPAVEDLERFAAGAAAPSIRDSIDAHLRSCSSCADRVAQVGSNLSFERRVQGALSERTRHTTPRAMPALDGFEVVSEIGRGGMGVVYEARQLDPPRSVAIKLLGNAAESGEYAFRLFQREAAALARLRHPAVATVIGAGHTHDGRRYLAMELVRGQTLDRYVTEASPSLPGRIRLFRAICAGVAHAHQRGVLHRDLKPTNVLVERDGAPKVLDFGLARIVDDEGSQQSTEAGRLQGTLRYMSPEQAGGAYDGIDLRTDVYSLGVILFELLTGEAPYALGRGSLVERLRVICETPPMRPRALVPGLPTDLELIVLKALEKDPARRYATVAEFSSDIQRFLMDEPIVARPPTAAYQLYKFARRHRLLVGVSVVAIALLAGTTAVATWQAVRATRAERAAVDGQSRAERAQQRAEVARDEAESVITFLTDMLTASDPADMGRDVRVVDVLDDAARLLQDGIPDAPAVAARLHNALGQAYLSLSDYESSAMHFRAAHTVASDAFDDDDGHVLRARAGIASVHLLAGERAEAERIFHELLERRRRKLGPDHPETLDTLSRYVESIFETGGAERRAALCEDGLERARKSTASADLICRFETQLGRVYGEIGDLERAEAHYQAAVREMERVHGSAHVSTLFHRTGLALFYKSVGRYAEAAAQQRDVLEGFSRAYGPDHHRTIGARRNLGETYNRQGLYDLAEPLLVEAVEQLQERLGPDNAKTLYYQTTLAACYQGQRRYSDAVQLGQQILAGRERMLGPEHPKTLEAMHNLGATLSAARRPRAALEMLEPALAGRRRVLGEQAFGTLNTMRALAAVYGNLGRLDQAATLLEEALEARLATVGERHVRTIAVIKSLASVYRRQKQWARAEELYLRARDLDQATLGPDHPDHLTNLNNLGTLYSGQGRFDEARALLEQVLAERTARGADDRSIAITRANLANVHAKLGNLADAIREYERAIDGLRSSQGGPPKRTLAPTMERLALVYERSGRAPEAVELLCEVLELRLELFGEGHAWAHRTRLTLGQMQLAADRTTDAAETIDTVYDALVGTSGPLSAPNRTTARRCLELCREAKWSDRAAAWRARIDEWKALEEERRSATERRN